MTYDFDQLFPTINTIKATGTIRQVPNDFKVTEINSTELSGTGEHLWVYIKKINTNTDWVAKNLSNVCQVPRRQVGFAGLKDRHAITKQWFSIQLPKVSDVEIINKALPEEFQIIESKFHNRKIRTGQLDANQFEILIKDIDGDKQHIEKNIQLILNDGVPNYFGPQRFGIEMGNIQKVQDWFSGRCKINSRNLKSLLISTARSHIFNLIVAKRIQDNQWKKTMRGDIFQLNKSRSWFHMSEATPEELSKRLKEFDIHITAAMYGEDAIQSTKECADLEINIAKQYPIYLNGFEKFRIKQDRRAIRIHPIDFKYAWQNNHLLLNFKLLPGAYATGIIREILTV